MNRRMIKGIKIEAHYGSFHRFKPTSLELLSKVGLKARILRVGGSDRRLTLPKRALAAGIYFLGVRV